VQNVVDRLSARTPQELPERMERLAKRLRGKLTLYDSKGQVVRSTAEVGPPATAKELKTLATEKWALAWRRIVVRSDDGTMIGVYEPQGPGFPWAFFLPLGAGVLVVAQESGSSNPVFPGFAAALCVGVRLVGLKYGINVPIAPSERQEDRSRD